MTRIGMASCRLGAEGVKPLLNLYLLQHLVSLLFGNEFDDMTVDMLLKFKEQQNISLCGLNIKLSHHRRVDFSYCVLEYTLQDCKLLTSEIEDISRLKSVCYIATRALISVLKE